MLRKAWTWIGLLLVTAAAIAVMVGVSLNWSVQDDIAGSAEETVTLTKTPVSVQRVGIKPIKIVEKFSGRLQPFESFTLAFEISGRLQAFGEASDGKVLDEGSRVKKGQVIAKLDDRLLKAKLLSVEAQLDEAKARLEKTDADYRRGKELRDKDSGLITDEDYEDRFTRWKESKARLAMAEALLEQAHRNLEDARIVAPVDGVISERHAQVGESIRQHDPVFEIVQIDRVLLVVGVPESKIRKIEVGQPVNIEFIGKDIFDRNWRSRTGRVHQIDETEDHVSKLFDVEVVVNNSTGDLKPGLIALANVEIQEIEGYRIPASSVLFRTERDKRTGARHKVGYIFSVSNSGESTSEEISAEGDEGDYIAKRFKLGDWVEQDMHLVLLDLPPEHHNLVVRGQHRLVDGRPVQIVSTKKHEPTADGQHFSPYGPDADVYDQPIASPGSGTHAAGDRQDKR